MITAHMSVNIESRSQQEPIEDLVNCLEELVFSLRDCLAQKEEPTTSTIFHNGSEINYQVVRLLKIDQNP